MMFISTINAKQPTITEKQFICNNTIEYKDINNNKEFNVHKQSPKPKEHANTGSVIVFLAITVITFVIFVSTE